VYGSFNADKTKFSTQISDKNGHISMVEYVVDHVITSDEDRLELAVDPNGT
jgi:hypothetical protein